MENFNIGREETPQPKYKQELLHAIKEWEREGNTFMRDAVLGLDEERKQILYNDLGGSWTDLIGEDTGSEVFSLMDKFILSCPIGSKFHYMVPEELEKYKQQRLEAVEGLKKCVR